VKSRDLVEALVAVLGVYELIEGLTRAAWLFPVEVGASPPESTLYVSATAFSAAVPIFLGSALILMRTQIAERLSPKNGAATAAPDDLLESLLTAAGVCLFVLAVASGAEVLVRMAWQGDPLSELFVHPHFEWTDLVHAGVQLGLGLVLAIGSRGIAATVSSIRHAGRQRATTDPPASE
jgi:hypothetical protein